MPRFMSLPLLISLRPAAGAAAVSTLAVFAIAHAPAAEHGRPAQHFQHFEHPGGPGARRDEPVREGPAREGPARGTGPGFNRGFAPGPRGVQTFAPEFRRGNPLPLNNPDTLRPNVPAARQDGPAPATAAPGGGPGVSPGAPDGTGQPGAMPAFTAPVRQPVVVRPLPPAGATAPAAQRPLDRGHRFVSVHGARHALVPVTALGLAVIGDSTWYPDAYVPMEGPACTGPTADGCQLEWRMVDFEDGDDEAQPQCVQYCPQPGPPPAGAAALPQVPPLPDGGGECQTTIYSEPNFAGNSAPTGGSQPVLSTTGWRNEIASIVVGAGTWDFFADENFSGEVLRLMPGTYPRLQPEWMRHIGSFMCVKGDVPPA